MYLVRKFICCKVWNWLLHQWTHIRTQTNFKLKDASMCCSFGVFLTFFVCTRLVPFFGKIGTSGIKYKRNDFSLREKPTYMYEIDGTLREKWVYKWLGNVTHSNRPQPGIRNFFLLFVLIQDISFLVKCISTEDCPDIFIIIIFYINGGRFPSEYLYLCI